MRDLFWQQRKNGANLIVPELYHGHLPEMACFKQDQCDYLFYGCGTSHGTDDNPPFLSAENHIRLEDDKEFKKHSLAKGTIRNAHIAVSACSAPDVAAKGGSPCTCTEYTQYIDGFSPDSETLVPPCYAWCHAMDRASFNWTGSPWGTECCGNRQCLNSYQSSLDEDDFYCGRLTLNALTPESSYYSMLLLPPLPCYR